MQLPPAFPEDADARTITVQFDCGCVWRIWHEEKPHDLGAGVSCCRKCEAARNWGVVGKTVSGVRWSDLPRGRGS